MPTTTGTLAQTRRRRRFARTRVTETCGARKRTPTITMARKVIRADSGGKHRTRAAAVFARERRYPTDVDPAPHQGGAHTRGIERILSEWRTPSRIPARRRPAKAALIV